MKSFVSPALLLILIATVYVFYEPAFSARFSFDDVSNLEDLSRFDPENLEKLRNFVVSGTSGPMGRPIALLSFALQAPYWPFYPGAFIYVNTLIHLINGLLVAWMALRLHRVAPSLAFSRNGFALSLAAVWLLQPLLASASLMVVQRMTTLSASFMLAGIIVYLVGRERLSQNKPGGWLLMLMGVGLGTSLAVLTKETGALLPLYLWVMEITLLRTNIPSRWIVPWRVVLAMPGVLILLYWVVCWDDLANAMQRRPFTIYERMHTEVRILADYVRLMFFPVRNALGPFHDDYPVAHGLLTPPSTLLYALAWLGLVTFAVIKRQRFPLLAFAVFWFLVGHLLESTVFSLELYFEHRNYLATLGPLVLLCSSLWRLPAEYFRLGFSTFLLYLGLLGFILRETNQVWGMPHVAAQLWYAEHPASERALQFLAQTYLFDGDEAKALAITREAFEKNPHLTGVGMQTIQMACYQGKDITTDVEKILPTLRQGERSYAALDAVKKLTDKLNTTPCHGLDPAGLHRMIDSLLTNVEFHSDRISLAGLYRLKAGLYLRDGQLDPVIRFLEKSFDAMPDIDTGMLIVGYLDSAGLYDDALEKIGYFRTRLPANPFARYQWQKRLDEAEPPLKRLSETMHSQRKQ